MWPPTKELTPYYQDDTCIIYNDDCRNVLPMFGDQTFDHCITDPPYSEHVHSNTRTNKEKTGGVHKLGFEHLGASTRQFVASEVRRLTQRWALVFTDVESVHLWINALSAHGMEYVRTGIWRKRGAMPQKTGDRPGSGYESIVIAHATNNRGKPKRKRWNGGGRVGVWDHQVPVARSGRVHPSEKPWSLMHDLLCDFTDAGNMILDPFAGSGSLGRAALLRKQRVVLIEQDERWCAQAASRRGAPVPETNKQTGLQW